MKYWKLEWTNWTNYYVPVFLQLPIFLGDKSKDHSEVKLEYKDYNCIIIGKPGEPSITHDLELFMTGVEYITAFKVNLERLELKEHPIKFNSDDIINWIINNNWKNTYLVNQLKYRKIDI